MADVARLAGCDASTVSLALRGDARITAATRAKVEKAASELGYKIHPMVAAWVARRRARHLSAQAVPLAYLTTHPPGVSWGKSVHFQTIIEAARLRVQEFGYQLTEYRLADYGNRLGALNRVWKTRAVQGVIVGPTLREYELPLIDWDCFCAVTIGYALKTPVLHRVTEDHFIGMKLAFELCMMQGHQRIGLAISGRHHQLRQERWIGAFLAEQQRCLKSKHRIPVLLPESGGPGIEPKMARQWAEQNQPSVVLADQPEFWRQLGLVSMGFAISENSSALGVHENNQGIGRHAADLLIAVLQRNERGATASRQTTLVEPAVLG